MEASEGESKPRGPNLAWQVGLPLLGVLVGAVIAGFVSIYVANQQIHSSETLQRQQLRFQGVQQLSTARQAAYADYLRGVDHELAAISQLTGYLAAAQSHGFGGYVVRHLPALSAPLTAGAKAAEAATSGADLVATQPMTTCISKLGLALEDRELLLIHTELLLQASVVPRRRVGLGFKSDNRLTGQGLASWLILSEALRGGFIELAQDEIKTGTAPAKNDCQGLVVHQSVVGP
jgi:hypothetical protein